MNCFELFSGCGGLGYGIHKENTCLHTNSRETIVEYIFHLLLEGIGKS